MSKNDKFRNPCLVAKAGSNLPNCHEYDYCSCDIKKLEAENYQLREEINSEWIRHIQEITEVQNSKELRLQEKIEKLEAENELLNKIKQNRNDLIEMNMNLQKKNESLLVELAKYIDCAGRDNEELLKLKKDLATTKEKLDESVKVINKFLNDEKDKYDKAEEFQIDDEWCGLTSQ